MKPAFVLLPWNTKFFHKYARPFHYRPAWKMVVKLFSFSSSFMAYLCSDICKKAANYQ